MTMTYTFSICPTGYDGLAIVDTSEEPLSHRGRWMGPFRTTAEAMDRAKAIIAMYGVDAEIGVSDRNMNDLINDLIEEITE